jgi:hypothetical protein
MYYHSIFSPICQHYWRSIKERLSCANIWERKTSFSLASCCHAITWWCTEQSQCWNTPYWIFPIIRLSTNDLILTCSMSIITLVYRTLIYFTAHLRRSILVCLYFMNCCEEWTDIIDVQKINGKKKISFILLYPNIYHIAYINHFFLP